MCDRCVSNGANLPMRRPFSGSDLLLPGAPGIIAFVATQQLCSSATRTIAPCGVRYVACHVQVALLLSFLGPPWSHWCSDLVRSLLFCSSGFWLRLFVARFWLVQVGSGVRCSSTWSVFLSVPPGCPKVVCFVCVGQKNICSVCFSLHRPQPLCLCRCPRLGLVRTDSTCSLAWS